MVLPGMVYKSDTRETIAHFRAVANGRPTCRSWSTTTRSAYSVDLKPDAFVELSDEPTLVAIKESSEDPRRITDLKQRRRRPLSLVLRGRRPGARELHPRRDRLGVGPGECLPSRESTCSGTSLPPGRFDEAREVYRWYTPLLHLDTHPKLVQYIKLANAECGYGTEMVRAPRLVLEGEERERILGIVRKAIATRPKVEEYSAP